MLEQILKENTSAVTSLVGPQSFYLTGPVSQALMTFYRYHYPNTTAESLVTKLLDSGSVSWSDGISEQDLVNKLLDFIGNLFGKNHVDNPKVSEHIGNPEPGITYLAVVEVLSEHLNRYYESGNVTTDIRYTDSTIFLVGTYTVTGGFTFYGQPISSASVNDVVSFRLINGEV